MARERTIDEVAEDVEELTVQVRRLGDRFDNAPFVRADLHNEQVSSLRSDLSSVKSMQMWILGIFGSILIAGVVTAITAVARGGLGA